MIVVALDNGHGTPCILGGKCSPDRRVIEPKWGREMVRRIDAGLRQNGIKTHILTPEEEDIPINERVRRVNALCREYGAQNILLVSVHCNAMGNDNQWHDAHGWSVFVSKNASLRSRRMAAIMTDDAERRGLTKGRCVPKEKYWTWDWRPDDIGILKRSLCPAVLTENMFMDNHADCDYLFSRTGKEAIAELHVKSIKKYIETL